MNTKEEFAVGKHNIGWIDPDFINHFGNKEFEPASAAPTYQKLTRRMTDAKIESGDLGHKPGFCTLGDVLAVLDSDNPEYKDGYANLFYTPACVVCVHRFGGGWRVSAWDRDDDGWDPGYRVFSPATGVSDTLASGPSGALALESKGTMRFDYIEIIKSENREVVCIGVTATPENKAFLKDIFGETVVIKKVSNN